MPMLKQVETQEVLVSLVFLFHPVSTQTPVSSDMSLACHYWCRRMPTNADHHKEASHAHPPR